MCGKLSRREKTTIFCSWTLVFQEWEAHFNSTHLFNLPCIQAKKHYTALACIRSTQDATYEKHFILSTYSALQLTVHSSSIPWACLLYSTLPSPLAWGLQQFDNNHVILKQRFVPTCVNITPTQRAYVIIESSLTTWH